MRLTPAAVFVLAPASAICALQATAFGLGVGGAHFENRLIGIQMMFSALPTHGPGGSPWILLSFPLLCVLFWEALETLRDRERMARWRDSVGAMHSLAAWAGRRIVAIAIATVVTVVFNFALGLAAVIVFGGLHGLLSLEETSQTILGVLIGVTYPFPLGYAAIWAYRGRDTRNGP